MQHRFSAALAGLTMVSALLIGGADRAGAAPTAPVSTPSPKSTTVTECPTVVPINAQVGAVTSSSVTIYYSMIGVPPCGFDPPIAFVAFAGRDDATHWINPVAEATSEVTRDGKVTIEGLTPDTEYWLRASAAGKPVKQVLETTRTAPPTDCPSILPISAKASRSSTSSVTISYTLSISPPCGYDPPITFTLFHGRDAALLWYDPVAEKESPATRTGTVTFDGLKSGTSYWFRASVAGKPDPYVVEPALTDPNVICLGLDPIAMDTPKLTATTLRLDYKFQLAPPCGYDPPITLSVYASRENAASGYQPLGRAVSGAAREGSLEIKGLNADMQYWFRIDAEGGPSPYWIDIVDVVRPTCGAIVAIAHQWDGGYLATVTIRNTGKAAFSGWRTTWQWIGDEKVLAVWNAEVNVTGATFTANNSPHNSELGVGEDTTFGMVVASSKPPTAPVASCSH